MARKMLGSVDLLGLNSFGDPVGMNPIWGTLIGGGVAGITSMAVGHAASGKLAANRELVGLGAGLAVAGVMYSMKSTRHAALGAALGAVIGAGLAWFEKIAFGTVQLPVATAVAAQQAAAGTSGYGMANIKALQGSGMGIAQMKALGMANIATNVPPAGHPAGFGGVAGLQAVRPGTMPANLLGAPSTASRQIALMGGPATHGIAQHYGATVIGGGRS